MAFETKKQQLFFGTVSCIYSLAHLICSGELNFCHRSCSSGWGEGWLAEGWRSEDGTASPGAGPGGGRLGAGAGAGPRLPLPPPGAVPPPQGPGGAGRKAGRARGWGLSSGRGGAEPNRCRSNRYLISHFHCTPRLSRKLAEECFCCFISRLLPPPLFFFFLNLLYVFFLFGMIWSTC